jgi:ABC-type branched-subunit amino acid transport system substrate-binding protein
MIAGKPQPTRKLRAPIPPGKWLLFFSTLIFFLILMIALILETIRTTSNPLVNVLTTLIAIPATVTGILQFPYFRSPTQRSLEVLQDFIEKYCYVAAQNILNHIRNQKPRTGMLIRHIDWKIIWAILSTMIALALFFNLLPTLSRLIIPSAQITCGNGLVISQETSGPASQQENIGISNGCYLFSDSERGTRSQDKTWSAQQYIAGRFQQQDVAPAEELWTQSINLDTSEAEARIYQENQRVLQQYDNHIAIIVSTMLTGNDASSTATGKVTLQGAYIQQIQYNTSKDVLNKNYPPLFLFVANIGSQAHFAEKVARQIVFLTSVDESIVGTMGWLFSTEETKQAAAILDQAHIASISPTISSDQFKGLFRYFFRIAPTDSDQGRFSALFARDVLDVQTAVVFVDFTNPYSNSLANGFSAAFKDDTRRAYSVPYQRGELANNPHKAAELVDSAVQKYPGVDLFFFAGYSNDFDPVRGRLLQPDLKDIPVMGGDGLYEQGGYQQTNPSNYQSITFTAFAHYELWDVLHLPKPQFATQYPEIFNPHHTSNAVDFNTAEGDAISSYDALGLLLAAFQRVYIAGSTPAARREELQRSLTDFDDGHPYLGLSGQIGFSTDGGPTNKPILLLCVTDGQQTHIKGMEGRFLLDQTSYAILQPDASRECRPNTRVQKYPITNSRAAPDPGPTEYPQHPQSRSKGE